MARKLIDIGIIGNDGTGDSIRDSFRKVNENFYELYGALGLGERLAFTNLGDTPDTYEGGYHNAVLAVDTNTDKIIFKHITGSEGITISHPAIGNEILIGIDFTSIYSQELIAASIRLGDGSSVSNFSTDSTFAENATFKIPVERAIREYLDRRLGITHTGTIVPANERIPNQSGFLPLSGQVPMQGNIDLRKIVEADPEDPDAQEVITYYKITNLGDAVDGRDAVNLQVLTQSLSDLEGTVTQSIGDLSIAVNQNINGVDETINQRIDELEVTLNPEEYQLTNSNILADAGISQSKLSLNIATTRTAAPTGTVAEIQAANGLSSFHNIFFTVTNGWVTLVNNSITYSKLQTVGARTLLGNNLTTVGNAVEIPIDDIRNNIINTNIGAAAAISQSKLSLNIATALASAPTGTAAQIQAANGLSSFDSTFFTVTNGRATIKDDSITLAKLQTITLDKLQTINARSLLGNAGYSPGPVAQVSFNSIVDDGGAIKKSQYTGVGFLRRKNSAHGTVDTDYEIIDMGAHGIDLANKLIQRDSNGDFSARIGSFDQLRVDSNIVIDTQIIGDGGGVRLYGWDGAGGIIVGGGPGAQDKTTQYDNNFHKFRTQNGLALAPIEASSVKTTSITTGSVATTGTITGYWSLTGTSRLESTYSADLAEYYEGDKEYPVGTVLVFGGEKEVTLSNKYMDTRIAGVISADAAFAMFKACPGYKNLIALQGRVPCKVVGKIAKGDLLVTSTLPGVAISAKCTAIAGSIIGKALENYDSDHIGMIQVAVGRA